MPDEQRGLLDWLAMLYPKVIDQNRTLVNARNPGEFSYALGLVLRGLSAALVAEATTAGISPFFNHAASWHNDPAERLWELMEDLAAFRESDAAEECSIELMRLADLIEHWIHDRHLP